MPFEKTEQALEFLKEVVNSSTYVLGEDFFISLDVASSSFYDKKLDKYLFEGKEYDSSSLIDFYQYLIDTYPILSIEDGLMEDDESWKEMTTRLGGQVLLVGDDLFVTNSELLQEGIKKNIANAIIIKPNQIGTLSETLNTIKLAQMSNYYPIISHRSGDSEDAFIADLAVGVNALFIKTGALGRSERTAKYNRLLEIEKELGVGAKFESAFIRSRVQKRKV